MNPPAASQRSRNHTKAAWKVVGKVLLFGAGAALAVWLITSAGAGAVAGVLEHAGGWLPLVILLEMLIVTTDFFGVKALLGEAAARVPLATWTRAIGLAYASSIVLPAGRAAGEAVRAATLAPALGAGRATTACSRLQAAVLVGNAALSMVAGVVIAVRGVSALLATAILFNGVLCGLLTAAVLWVVRNDRVAQWLKKRFPRLAETQATLPSGETGQAALRAAAIFCCVGRVFQTVQYGVVLYAVGGLATPAGAVTAQGIHIVGATLGDLVPNQMGATEGAYRFFASALGLAAEPARALSIALVVRLAQLSLAAVGFVAAMAAIRQPRSAEAP
jgi:hypothetical protein